MRLSYVRVLVTDFAGSFRFYRDIMGFEVLWGDENNVYAEFQAGPATRLAVTARKVMAGIPGVSASAAGGANPERFMLVFEVDDVDARVAALKSRGAAFLEDPVDRPEWTVRTAHLRDPEGNLIEINTPLRS